MFVSGCTSLTSWDDPEVITLRQIDMRSCVALRQLPPNLHEINQVDVSGCSILETLPPNLRVREWIDIGGTKIKKIPLSETPVALRWNGVAISGRIAFHPNAITLEMVLTEPKVEVRRVMKERMGERFFTEMHAKIVDADHDRGGARRLLRARMPEDKEYLLALQVRDPSTGRGYILQVPAHMKTCHQAAAWLAGFDNPDDYQPIVET